MRIYQSKTEDPTKPKPETAPPIPSEKIPLETDTSKKKKEMGIKDNFGQEIKIPIPMDVSIKS